MKTNNAITLLLVAAMATLATACNKEEGSNHWTRPLEESGNNVQSAFDENGASTHYFSVGKNKKARFSRGNLQYRASTNSWRFAEHQYDFCHEGNNNISPTYDGWIDLFGWGTSGWGNKQPYTASTDPADYIHLPNWTTMTGYYAEADWGVHNSISNGGNKAGLWRTPTIEEWLNLCGLNEQSLNFRQNLVGAATIAGNIHGFVILPDDWICPSGLEFKSFLQDRGINWESNKYSLYEWEQMEAAGAIFLPAAWEREGTEAQTCDFYDGYDGYRHDDGGYWSSTAFDTVITYEGHDYNYFGGLTFYFGSISPWGIDYVGYTAPTGLPVRLICD